MNMIVAADDNWAIGYGGKLLFQIPSDRKFLEQSTRGKAVVMGRKTLESLPGGKPLPGRDTFVLTKNERLQVRGARMAHSVRELLKMLGAYRDEDVFVLGGGEVYRQLLPYTGVVHVTKVHHRYRADTWFPDLDRDEAWTITADSEEQTYFDVEFEFLKYERLVSRT